MHMIRQQNQEYSKCPENKTQGGILNQGQTSLRFMKNISNFKRKDKYNLAWKINYLL